MHGRLGSTLGVRSCFQAFAVVLNSNAWGDLSHGTKVKQATWITILAFMRRLFDCAWNGQRDPRRCFLLITRTQHPSCDTAVNGKAGPTFIPFSEGRHACAVQGD